MVIKGGFQGVSIHIQNNNFLQPTIPHPLSDKQKQIRAQCVGTNLTVALY